jgi:hypothetical protein
MLVHCLPLVGAHEVDVHAGNEGEDMSASNAMQKEQPKGDKDKVTVTVNGKPVTLSKKTTVGAVLSEAGYDPATHYLVEVKHGDEGKAERDPTKEITLHEGDEFRAYYTGDTPLS